MPVHDKTELFVVSPGVVSEIQGVRVIFIVLPNVRQQYFESTAVISLDGAVLHYPVKEIVGMPRVTTELIYPFTVVRDQAVVYVN